MVPLGWPRRPGGQRTRRDVCPQPGRPLLGAQTQPLLGTVPGMPTGRPRRGGPCSCPSPHQVKCYHKKSRPATRDVIFRLQLHTGAVQGCSLVFGKEALDSACEGEGPPVPAAVRGAHRPSLFLCSPCPLPGMTRLTELRPASGKTDRGPCAGCAVAGLLTSRSVSDDRFPANGKVELLFSATPERIQGGSRAGRRAAGPHGGWYVGVSPTVAHVGEFS